MARAAYKQLHKEDRIKIEALLRAKHRPREIAEILGFSEGEIRTRTLYAFEENSRSTRERVCGELIKKGELTHVEKLEEAGVGREGRENGL